MEERAELTDMCGSGVVDYDSLTPDGARTDAVLRTLLGRGCVSFAWEPCGEDEECPVYEVTDLGRLALRVAVAIPPVQL